MAAAWLPALALAVKWRKVSIAHWLMIAAFLAAGTLSFRFSLLMTAATITIAAPYFATNLNNWLSRGNGIALLLLWFLTNGLLADTALGRTSLSAVPLEAGVIPFSAVDYLERSQPQGNLYNFYEYGGYVSWRLYPKKIFIDQRCLSWDTYEEYSRAWRGDYSDVFNKYRIGAVFYPVFERPTGKLSRLVAGLLNDRQWTVGYYDGRDIVFLNSDLNGNQAVLDKARVIQDIVRRLRG
jgi:hypothetical protein